VKLLDSQVEMKTKYGLLKIPVADIRKIECVNRTPPLIADRIEKLIESLNHPDYATREKHTAELREIGPRAYVPCIKAAKNPDPEINRRASEIVAALQQKFPGKLSDRENDTVQTADGSSISGMILCKELKVATSMFGEQTMPICEVRTLTASGVVAAHAALANAPDAPANMMGFQHQFGKEMVCKVTAPAGGHAGGIWGTDLYTLDSNITAAAVHAGIVQPGQTAVVKLRVVASPPQFTPSIRNGVSSTGYGNYPAGAYELLRP
jgi:hypothetical protein